MTEYLERYTINISEKISQKPSDYKVFGREKEVAAVITSLLRRTKNNPILVGEPGVGKTAILEGLALEILNGTVPARLKSLTVRSLELSSLMNEQDGNFIFKLRQIVEELKENKGLILLFIDEFHTVVGTGSQEGNALDAGNILKPALARGDVQIIGATTLDEFHEYIETDGALERRLQPIMVAEPTIPEAIRILESAKKIYESFHGVNISSAAVEQAVALSVRYITDRFLPDKAFDLIDEAATVVSANSADTVSEKDIAEVLKRKTGIPVTTILQGDEDRIQGLKEKLKERVKGQDEAIEAVVDAVEIGWAGLQDENKPISSFLFLGASGVGKTELAKALAEALFDDENAMIRLDMSEYSSKKDIVKLIGDRETRSKGYLTEAVKRKPYSVILIDEIEKGEGTIHNLFLQILDDGRLTDATGRLISFKNTIVIMTSNTGSKEIIENFEIKGSFKEMSERDKEQFRESVDIELETEFRPEFLNRIENTVIFNLLERDTIEEIVLKNLFNLEKKMEKQNLTLSYEPELVVYLADAGTSVKKGARPLARLMKKKIIAPVSSRKLRLPVGGSYNFHISVLGEKPTRKGQTERRTLDFDITELPISV